MKELTFDPGGDLSSSDIPEYGLRFGGLQGDGVFSDMSFGYPQLEPFTGEHSRMGVVAVYDTELSFKEFVFVSALHHIVVDEDWMILPLL